tara:strand:- start:1 stop:1017 length:1017 start_codon:yes stop_codon:yes gene_type:complete
MAKQQIHKNRTLTIGITDHYQEPYDIEEKAFGEKVKFINFNSRDEKTFNEEILQKIDALLVFHARITEKTIKKLINCKIIVRYGVGTDNIDLDALKKYGIPACNTPDYGIEEIAATATAHLLNLWRRISAYDIASRNDDGNWAKNIITPITRISEATLGVIGTGRIGTNVIKNMKPYGCRIIGFDQYQTEEHAKEHGYMHAETLEQLLTLSDAISLNCVLTKETTGIVDEDFIKTMRKGALLVNTARGGLFKNLDVLESGLKSGHLGGVGTDVLPKEPPDGHSLINAWKNFDPWLYGRFVVTPHTAYYSESALYDMRYKAAETASLFLKRNELRNRIV